MPLSFSHVSYTYGKGTPFEYRALQDVCLDIAEGKMTALIGETGSGKSTLVQHLNALLLPMEGTVQVLDRTITAGEKPKQLKALRRRVGLVFQFPEYQLFEETVLKDVAFGPKNFGTDEPTANRKAAAALAMVGLNKDVYEKSPLELSGGQKRRAAIAGILAMDPEVLVLDEPTAGLDPKGTTAMMNLFQELNQIHHKTILIVTHDMEQVYRYCADVIVLSHGRVLLHTDTESFFSDPQKCRDMNILPPAAIRMQEMLRANGFTIPQGIRDTESLAKCIAAQVKSHE